MRLEETTGVSSCVEREPVTPGNSISRWAGPMVDWVLLTPRRYRSLNRDHRKLSFPQSLLGSSLVWGGTRLDMDAHTVHSHMHGRAHCAPSHHTLWQRLKDRGLLCCVVVRIQLAGSESEAICSQWASEGAHSGVAALLKKKCSVPEVGGCDDAVPLRSGNLGL